MAENVGFVFEREGKLTPSEIARRGDETLAMVDLQGGKGLAGFLLRDEQTKGQMAVLLTNLVTLSSNLNKYGLLYKPKPPRSRSASPDPQLGGRKP